MARGKGVDIVMGIKKATTWGTSVVVGAANLGFRAKSWTYDENIGPGQDDSFNADAFRRESVTIRERRTVSGTFTVDAKYQGLTKLVALFFGTAGVPTLTAGYYVHTILVKDDLDGIFFSLAWFDSVKTIEIDSAKFKSMKISIKAGMVVEMEFAWEGRRLQYDTATNANLTSLTEPSTITRVQSTAAIGTYKIAVQAGSLTAQAINSAEVTFTRGIDNGDLDFTSTDAPDRSEMVAGRMDCTGTMTIPYASSTLAAAAQSGALYKFQLDHVLTSGQTEFGIWLPSVQIAKATMAPGSSYGAIPQVIDFIANKASSTPSEFTQAVPYFRNVNSDSADPLA